MFSVLATVTDHYAIDLHAHPVITLRGKAIGTRGGHIDLPGPACRERIGRNARIGRTVPAPIKVDGGLRSPQRRFTCTIRIVPIAGLPNAIAQRTTW